MKTTLSDFLSVFSMYAIASILAYHLMGALILPFAGIAFLYIFSTLVSELKER